MKLKRFWQYTKAAAQVWYDADADHKAATVSYYMIFAVVPLLLLSVAIHSLVFGRDFIVDTLNDWGSVLGTDILGMLSEAVRNLQTLSDGFTIPFFGILFFTGMVITAFNTFATGVHGMWGIRHRGFRGWLRKCRHSIVFIVIFEVYLFCMLTVSYVLSVVPTSWMVLTFFFDGLFFLAMTATLFTLAFRVLPWQSPDLRSCIWGAFVASILLYIARVLVALYISVTPVPNLFGVAGLIVALLIWIFASAAIVYFGAAFAFVHGDRKLQ